MPGKEMQCMLLFVNHAMSAGSLIVISSLNERLTAVI